MFFRVNKLNKDRKVSSPGHSKLKNKGNFCNSIIWFIVNVQRKKFTVRIYTVGATPLASNF
jgi:hypothetical protein